MKSSQEDRPSYYALLESPETEAFRAILQEQNALLESAEDPESLDKKTWNALEKRREKEIARLYDVYPLNPVVIDWYADTRKDVAEARNLKEMARSLLTHDDPMRDVLAEEIEGLSA